MAERLFASPLFAIALFPTAAILADQGLRLAHVYNSIAFKTESFTSAGEAGDMDMASKSTGQLT
jgi:hypothetical protein